MNPLKPRIVVSQHGTLIDNLYFTLFVNDEENLKFMFERAKSGMHLMMQRSPPEHSALGETHRYFKAERTGARVSSGARALNRCGRDADHAIGIWGSGGIRFDEVSGELSLGQKLSDTFIASDTSFIINSKFGNALRQSGLIGFELLPFQVVLNQSLFCGKPELDYLQVLGKNCLRRWKVEVEQNLCPLCKKAPIYCPDCGWIPVLCPACHRPAFKEFEFIHEWPETSNSTKKTSLIVEVKDSEGADFFQYGMRETMISRRALIFLIEVGAAPFVAYSQWACIDDLTSQQRAEVDLMLATPLPLDRCEVRYPDR